MSETRPPLFAPLHDDLEELGNGIDRLLAERNALQQRLTEVRAELRGEHKAKLDISVENDEHLYAVPKWEGCVTCRILRESAAPAEAPVPTSPRQGGDAKLRALLDAYGAGG